jgi:hypothetical protein
MHDHVISTCDHNLKFIHMLFALVLSRSTLVPPFCYLTGNAHQSLITRLERALSHALFLNIRTLACI